MSRKVVRCCHCDMAAIDWGVGFVSIKSYFCTLFEQKVYNDDGCTFGTQGQPRRYICHNAEGANLHDPIVYGYF